MGLIAIEAMQFYSHHGYYKEEQVLGGKYTVDVYMQVDFEDASSDDDLSKTINYEKVFAITKKEMEAHSKLIEHVCKRILDAILMTFPNVTSLKVRVSKFNPPLKGNVERVFVELESK